MCWVRILLKWRGEVLSIMLDMLSLKFLWQEMEKREKVSEARSKYIRSTNTNEQETFQITNVVRRSGEERNQFDHSTDTTFPIFCLGSSGKANGFLYEHAEQKKKKLKKKN